MGLICFFAIQPALIRTWVPSKRSLFVAKRIQHLYKTLQVHNAMISAQSCVISLTRVDGKYGENTNFEFSMHFVSFTFDYNWG